MAANYEMNKVTKKGWTKQPNAILRDKDLTSDAYKVISFLLSITGDYHISESGIASSVNLSLERVKKAVKLLKSTGYIEVSKSMHNYRLNGYIWKISDTNGTYRKCNFREVENQATENQATENPSDVISSDREIKRPKTRLTENPSTYEYTERYEQTNNEKQKNEQTEENELLHLQPDAEEESLSPSFKKVSSWESSSEANASPLSNKNTSNGEQIISHKEYLFRRFANKYPKAILSRELAATRMAFFEIPDLEMIFDDIMGGLDAWIDSAEWNRDGGRWIKKPLNFIKERQWEKIQIAEKSALEREIMEDALAMAKSWEEYR